MATPTTKDINFFVNSGVDLGGGWEFYAFGSYGERDGLSAANYRNQNAAANRDFGTLLPNQTPTAANFMPLTADGFLPYIDTDLQDYAGNGRPARRDRRLARRSLVRLRP